VSEPVFTVLLVLLFSLFFSSKLYESNPRIIYPALIAGLAIIFSHIKKHHLSFNKYFMAATLGSFFFASELIISRLILDYYSPFSFYFIRCVSLLFVGLIVLNPKLSNLKKLDKSVYFGMLGLGIIWALYRVIVYWGYIHLGMVSTTLILMLSPIFIYLFAWKFLHEKPSWRNIVASIIIIICVIYGESLI
jgi:drug/metabolite transporter (DMT)-like permease